MWCASEAVCGWILSPHLKKFKAHNFFPYRQTDRFIDRTVDRYTGWKNSDIEPSLLAVVLHHLCKPSASEAVGGEPVQDASHDHILSFWFKSFECADKFPLPLASLNWFLQLIATIWASSTVNSDVDNITLVVIKCHFQKLQMNKNHWFGDSDTLRHISEIWFKHCCWVLDVKSLTDYILFTASSLKTICRSWNTSSSDPHHTPLWTCCMFTVVTAGAIEHTMSPWSVGSNGAILLKQLKRS